MGSEEKELVYVGKRAICLHISDEDLTDLVRPAVVVAIESLVQASANSERSKLAEDSRSSG
jgi:hypothetical protein